MKREIKQYQKHIADSVKYFGQKTEQQLEKIANSNGEQSKQLKLECKVLLLD